MKNNNLDKFFKELVSMSIQEKDGDIWFSSANRNGLYRVNRKTHDITEKCTFENEEKSEHMLYHNMEISGSRIFFAPHRAEKIAVYDIDQKEIKYLELKPVEKGKGKVYDPGLKFGNTFQDGSYVYLLGYTYPAIVKIHRETLELTYIDCWVDEINSEAPKHDTRGYFTMGHVKRNRKVILPIGYMSGLLELDLDTDETRLIRLDSSLEGIGGIAGDKDGVAWIVGRGWVVNKIVRWDMQKNELKELKLPMVEKNCLVPFYEPLCYANRVFLFPVYSSHAYELDTTNEKVSIRTIFDSCIKGIAYTSHLPMRTFSPRIIDKKIKFITGWDRKWHEYSLESNAVESFRVLDGEHIEECAQESVYRSLERQDVVMEGLYSLYDFMDFMISGNDKKYAHAGKGMSGEGIYSAIRDENRK